MNFLICTVIAIIFFGIGWVVGVKNLSNIEKLTDNLEKAADYVENLETPDVDEMNIILNINRDTNAAFNIKILQNIEDGDLDKAKEILVNHLESDYDDIKEDALHDISSEESKDIIKQIETLAEKYPVFQTIVDSSQIE